MKPPKTLFLTSTLFILLAAGCGTPETDETYILSLKAEIEKLEAQCVPKQGTSREEVESVFGSGVPRHVVVSIVPQEEPPPEDSPMRHYKLFENGILRVRYDEQWKVKRAGYNQPYSLKNRGSSYPVDDQIRELEAQLKHMNRILEEYHKRVASSTAP